MRAVSGPRVDFFIIGVQKGGTTALDQALRQHPQIQMAAGKELHFFDDEQSVDWNAPDYGLLHRFFDWTAQDVLRGEATPITIYWPQSLERLQAYNPAAKLIVMLRHPVHRAFSHWAMETARGYETLDFDAAISPAGRRRCADAPGAHHRVFSYVERGLYAGQIERLLSLFPRRQALFLRTDRFWQTPAATLASIAAFLGVDAAPFAAARSRYIVPVPPAPTPPLRRRTARRLSAIFAETIERTGALTGLDLADWHSPRYQEPMPALPAAVPPPQDDLRGRLMALLRGK